MWWSKKKCEHEFVPKPEVLPNVCLQVMDKLGNKREILCRTSSISASGILTLQDNEDRVVAQYAAGFWKRTIVLEAKKAALPTAADVASAE